MPSEGPGYLLDGAADHGRAVKDRATAIPCQVKRKGTQRRFILGLAPSSDNEPDNELVRENALPNATCRNGYIGRGTRYRLGEVLYGFYTHAEEHVGTDVEDDVVFPLCKSLRHTADFAGSARTYPTKSWEA